MSNPTDVTPTAIRGSATRHLNTRDSIRGLENTITDQVADFCNKNEGELIRKLQSLQEDWTQDIEAVQGKLGDLADYMESAALFLEQLNASQGAEQK